MLQPEKKNKGDSGAVTESLFEELLTLPAPASFAYVYGCSPRAGGNSDYASMLVESELDNAGLDSDGCFLREYDVKSCGGCQQCGELPGEICRYAPLDDASELFAPILTSKVLFFISPIYFYHLPSHFKSFIDRGQAYWIQRRMGSPLIHNLPKRRAYVVLFAAREKGEKMFLGSLLTLRFFLKPFNIELAEPLLLRGVDKENDLKNNKHLQEQIAAYVRAACEKEKEI